MRPQGREFHPPCRSRDRDARPQLQQRGGRPRPWPRWARAAADDELFLDAQGPAQEGRQAARCRRSSSFRTRRSKIWPAVPHTLEEMQNITGVARGQGPQVLARSSSLIKAYVEEKEIIRPQDMIFRQRWQPAVLKIFTSSSRSTEDGFSRHRPCQGSRFRRAADPRSRESSIRARSSTSPITSGSLWTRTRSRTYTCISKEDAERPGSMRPSTNWGRLY